MHVPHVCYFLYRSIHTLVHQCISLFIKDKQLPSCLVPHSCRQPHQPTQDLTERLKFRQLPKCKQNEIYIQCARLEEEVMNDLRLSAGVNKNKETNAKSQNSVEYSQLEQTAYSGGPDVEDKSPFSKPERPQGDCFQTVGFNCLWKRFVKPEGTKLKDVLIEIHTRLSADAQVHVGVMTLDIFRAFSRTIGKLCSGFL